MDRVAPGVPVRIVGLKSVGRVRPAEEGSGIPIGSVLVAWSAKHLTIESIANLEPAIQQGNEVRDVSTSGTGRSLGTGVVVAKRELAGHVQALVDFHGDNRLAWLPWYRLAKWDGPETRFRKQHLSPKDSGERLRLRMLGAAITRWCDEVSPYAGLGIDPLPHQIQLVHRILSSGNINWLIADDVGLGKTIEVGMLVVALRERRQAGRVLVVCPPGLSRQWKEEMHLRFALDGFRIFREDFHAAVPADWNHYRYVIASIDSIKSEENVANLLAAEDWDLVVFDEAHRLSRREWNSKFEASQRYALAANLRRKSSRFLLLSGTPHQGMPDKFRALLELIRPELKEQISKVESHPEILAEMVIRNEKDKVTDINGQKIFQGKSTRNIPVHPAPVELVLDSELVDYLKRGYSASALQGTTGRAIGFTMSTYRKLASSSHAAILGALRRRSDRLTAAMAELRISEDAEIQEGDERFAGEAEERLLTSSHEFFAGEVSLVQKLISGYEAVMGRDAKLTALMDTIIPAVRAQEPDAKLVIFTEYRGTQDYLIQHLGERFGRDAVACINGSMDINDRREAVRRFEGDARFLVSTEAGGEGLNLHRRCHVLVNYDLPWNPMRLVQRMGRIYRYGQLRKVVVFNMTVVGTIDGNLSSLLNQRIATVVSDMATVNGEFRPGLEDEILGQLADLLDVESILQSALTATATSTEAELEEALRTAQAAVRQQQELFSFASGFDPSQRDDSIRVDDRHLLSFTSGMFTALGMDVGPERSVPGRDVRYVRPSPQLKKLAGLLRGGLRFSTDIESCATNPEIHLLNAKSVLLQKLLRESRSIDFGGLCGQLYGIDAGGMFAARLCWQDERGTTVSESLTLLHVPVSGTPEINPPELTEWLLVPQDGAPPREDRKLNLEVATKLADASRKSVDRVLANGCGASSLPRALEMIAAGVVH